ncbi:MAG: hypothetical protein OHK0039_00320 [Bacteroidia bacterium]
MLETLVNDKLEQFALEEQAAGSGGSSWLVRVSPVAPVRLRGRGAFLQASLVLRIELRPLGVAALPLLRDITSAEVLLTMETALSIDPDGQLRTQTQGSYQWQERSEPGLRWLRGSVEAMVRRVMDYEVDLAAQRIDSQLKKAFSLREVLAESWVVLHRHLPIEGPPPAVLDLSPSAEPVRYSPIEAAPGHLSTWVAVQLAPQIGAGTHPAGRPVPPMPPIVPVASLPPQSVLPLHLHLTWEALAAWIVARGAAPPLRIEACILSGTGSDLAAEVAFTWRGLWATALVRGSLQAEPAQERLRMIGIQTAFRRGNWLVGTAMALARRRIAAWADSLINQQLRSSLADVIRETRVLLADMPLENDVARLQIRLDQVQPEVVEAGDTGLSLRVGLAGQVVLLVERLDA